MSFSKSFKGWFSAKESIKLLMKNRLKKYLYKVGLLSKVERIQMRAYFLVETSVFFDPCWYLSKNPDVEVSGIDPITHYLNHGAQERRDPGPNFDSQYYLTQVSNLPELQRQVGNPLLHFLTIGQKSGLKCFPPTGLDLDLNQTDVSSIEQPSSVAIVIPVYNALDELRACLQSLIEHTYFPCRIILIDDASPDSRISSLLEEFLSFDHFEVYRNNYNLGFSGTINRGLGLAGDSDVVLLNADTVVVPGWLGRLRVAAYQQSDIGTVTPVSNNAGVFSVPHAGSNDLPVSLSITQTGRLVSQNSLRYFPQTPTGNGFCLYIRRDCMQDVGGFDAEAFPRGYGEENDFCMRALKQGWRHIIDDSTWIYHVRSASFGEEKTELIKAGRQIVDARYPDYSYLVRKAFSSEKISAIRERAAQLYHTAHDSIDPVNPRPRILYVISTLTGGTPQTNEDLMSSLSDEIDAYVLRCDSKTLSLHHYCGGYYEEVARVVLSLTIQASIHRSDEYDQVVKVWLAKWAIELVHIRHIAWHSLGLVEVTQSLGIPCIFSVHDFYSICPSVKLLDNHLQYCGGNCTAGQGACDYELWPQDSFSALKHTQIKPWKTMFESFLFKCDGFITTNVQAKSLLLEHYPYLNHKPFEVVEHGRDFNCFQQVAVPIEPCKPIRLLILGNITPAKGGYLLQTLAEKVPLSQLEIHILGDVSPLLNLPPKVVCHGEYQREELCHVISQIKPHIGAVLSIWPETWCHALTEYWAYGIPVMGFKLGAVGQRIARSEAGWLLDSIDVQTIQSTLLNIEQSDWHKKREAVIYWQQTQGSEQTCQAMAKQYWGFYKRVWSPLIQRNG